MTVAEERFWDLRCPENFSRAVSKLMGVGKSFILQVIFRLGIVQDMMERSNMKVKKNKLLYWILVGVMGVFMVRLVGSVWRLWKAGERIKQAELEVRNQESENQELKKRLAEVQSPEFIEKEAREKLGLGKPDEEIVVLPEVPVVPAVPAVDEQNWRLWWRLYISD